MAHITDDPIFPIDPNTYAAVRIIEGALYQTYGGEPELLKWHKSPSLRGAKTYHGKLTHALEYLSNTGSIAVEEIKGGMN